MLADRYAEILEAAALADGASKPCAARSLAVAAQLALLPQVHQNALKFMIQHLLRVVELEAQNLMTLQNVAVVSNCFPISLEIRFFHIYIY